MRRLLPIGLLALAVASCGDSGAGSDEDAIRTSIERYFAKDKRGCDLETGRLLRNTEGEADLAAALRECRKDEEGASERELAEVDLEPSRGTSVSGIAVDGAKARAKARLEGGDTDGQMIDVRLVKQRDDWKLDHLDGIRVDDRLRDKIDRAFGVYFRRSLQGDVAADEIEPAVQCIVAGVRRAVPNERLAEDFEGNLPPETLSPAIEKVARDCLLGDDGKTVSGTGYEIGVPGGWKDVTPAKQKQLEVVLSSAGATVNVVRETNLPAGITLDRYFEAGRGRAGVELPRTPEPATLGGEDAITYTFPNEARDGGKLRQRQVVAIRDSVAYVVTFSARDASFADQSKDFDAILASWRWK
jgi:hypothetical protein